MSVLLEVKNLQIEFKVLEGVVNAVNGLSFKVYDKEIIGIVGESGSGKSQTMMAIMGLLGQNALVNGSVKFMQQELLGLSVKEINEIRGDKLAMIFQDPMTCLNPYLKISTQMVEVLVQHKKMDKRAALIRSMQMLDFVKIPEAKKRIHFYPHQFSGGMRQRVMIAMALLCSPRLLIADEPTTALDVTVQAQILELLKQLKREFGTSIVFITHDMGVVAHICDRINVMYGGWLMETGSVYEVFKDPRHPYTSALLGVIPSFIKKDILLKTIAGEPPNLLNLPSGCPFAARCGNYIPDCNNGDIALTKIGTRRVIKCINP